MLHWKHVRPGLYEHADGYRLEALDDGIWHAYDADGRELLAVCVDSSRLPHRAHLAELPDEKPKPLGPMDRHVHLLPDFDPDDPSFLRPHVPGQPPRRKTPTN